LITIIFTENSFTKLRQHLTPELKMPVNHVGIAAGPSRFKEIRAFYLKALGPLGYSVYKEQVPQYCGLAPKNGGPDFWLHCGGESADGQRGTTHIAFDATSTKMVDDWFKIAL
jgi:hypothetical protein